MEFDKGLQRKKKNWRICSINCSCGGGGGCLEGNHVFQTISRTLVYIKYIIHKNCQVIKNKLN